MTRLRLSHAFLRAADDAAAVAHRRVVLEEGAADAAARLAESEALRHRTAEDDAQRQQTLVGDRRGAGDHKLDAVEAELRSHLLEDQLVVQRVVQPVRLQQQAFLRVVGASRPPSPRTRGRRVSR